MTEGTVKKRIDYLDIAKGIGIIMVILGHCTTLPDRLNLLIFSVHMPLFFILSGYTFKRSSARDTKKFLLKNVKALIIPYVITVVIVVLLQILQAILRHWDVGYEAIRWITAGIYGSGGLYPEFFENAGIPMTFIGAIWFLLALFVAKVLLMFFLKTRTPFLWVMISFFTGYVTSHRIGWFPFSIQAGMCAVLFLYIGLKIREHELFQWEKVHWIMKVLMLLVWIYCIIFCGKLWMVSNEYTDGIIDVIGAVCGTFIIVYISQGLDKIRFIRKIFVWLGKNSLGLMCAHMIVLDCWPMADVVVLLMRHIQISYLTGELICLFVLQAVVTAVLYVLPWIRKKMFPASFPEHSQV